MSTLPDTARKLFTYSLPIHSRPIRLPAPTQNVLVQVSSLCDAGGNELMGSSKSDAAPVQNFYPITTYAKGYGALSDKDTHVS